MQLPGGCQASLRHPWGSVRGGVRMATARLFLIDASGYVYRAFHALPALNTSRGLPTNATLGFANMVAKLLRVEKPDYLAVVFDAPGDTFRDALYAEYKQNRAPMPDDLRPQIPYIRKLVAALRLPVIEEVGVEADDVIGTLATRAVEHGLETVIVTADKDMTQLVSERTTLYDDMRNRRIGIAEVRERFGVDPPLVPEVLRLLLMELEFMALLRELTPSGPTATATVERRAVSSVSEVAAVVHSLGKDPAVALYWVADSPRATAARLTAVVLAGVAGPSVVVTSPEDPDTLAALAPLCRDFAITKLGDDLKALRVVLARRRAALAGPAMDLAVASYCLNPSQPVHDTATLAHELLGEPAAPGGDPIEAACRDARSAHGL